MREDLETIGEIVVRHGARAQLRAARLFLRIANTLEHGSARAREEWAHELREASGTIVAEGTTRSAARKKETEQPMIPGLKSAPIDDESE